MYFDNLLIDIFKKKLIKHIKSEENIEIEYF